MKELSCLFIDEKGRLSKIANLGNDKIKFILNGVSKHSNFGINFTSRKWKVLN
jgi:hypothetical protein